jgi:hypothetical protein
MATPFTRILDHTQRRTTFCMTPLDECSAPRRDLYLTTHNRQTSMPPVGLEPTIAYIHIYIYGLHNSLCRLHHPSPVYIIIYPIHFMFISFHRQIHAIIFYISYIYLTAFGLTPGGSSTSHIYTQTVHIMQRKENWEVRAVARLCELKPGVCLTTEEKARKNLS